MNDKLIRFRFICAIVHLVILLVTLIWKREAIAKDVLPFHEMYVEDEAKLKIFEKQVDMKAERLSVILGAGIGLISVELCLFLIGVSMFKNWQCLLSSLCHLSGACSSTYLLYSGWVESVYIVIFSSCILLPVVTEGFILITYMLKNI